MSQGHSDAVRKIKGVIDARQYTLPIEKAMNRVRSSSNPELKKSDMHIRLVYVIVEKGADRKRIEHEIKTIPDYFADYKTKVVFVSREKLDREH